MRKNSLSKIIPLVGAMFIVSGTTAAIASGTVSPKIMPLWSDSEPAPTRNEISGPETNDGEDRLANISTPEIHIYSPDPAKNSGIAVLIVPGGGYEIVSMRYEGESYARFLASEGITGVVLKYRLPNGNHTIPTDDAMQAMRLVHRNAAQWGINPHAIGISGFSAGGHLAATTATHALDAQSRAYFMILFYPVVTFMDDRTHQGSRWGLTKGATEWYRFYSPECNITLSTPPTLTILSLDDNAVQPENSTMITDSLRSHGIRAEMVTYPDGGHGWGLNPDFKHADKVRSDVMTFIRSLSLSNDTKNLF